MKVRIEIDTKTFVRFWLVVIGFAFAILAIYSALSALVIIGAAFFLSLALNKPVSWLAGYMPGKSRVGGTALAFLLVVVVLAAVVFLVIPPIVQQTARFIETLPTVIDTAVIQWRGFDSLIQQYDLQSQVVSIQETIKSNATSWAANLGNNLLSGVGSLLSTIAATFLMLVLSFLMLIEGPSWMARVWALYDNKERMEAHRNLVHRMYQMVTGYVTGQLTVSFIGASLAGLAVFIISFFFNIPSNLALPTVAITFTLSLIPMFGATISGVLISLLLAFNDVMAGVSFALYFIVYQQIENNFVSPVIQARKVELSALAVLISVTIGLYVFGLAGGIISIPIAACLRVLIEDYVERSRARRTHKPKPEHFKKIVGKMHKEKATE